MALSKALNEFHRDRVGQEVFPNTARGMPFQPGDADKLADLALSWLLFLSLGLSTYQKSNEADGERHVSNGSGRVVLDCGCLGSSPSSCTCQPGGLGHITDGSKPPFLLDKTGMARVSISLLEGSKEKMEARSLA